MGTFTQKTDYLIETKGLLKDRIKSLGGSITNQTTFRDYLVWLDSLYEALDEKTITGLPDSLEGNITQTTTQTGKNLLPNNATTQEINGITYTINEDKSININGTATGGRADLWLYGSSTDTGNYIFIPKGNYTINTANLTDGRLFLSFREKTAGVKYVTSQNHSLFDLLAQQDCYLYGVMMGAERGQTFNNITIYPQLEKGSSPSSYEPFIPNSPSPDYPQPINVVSGRQVVSVCGKNLINQVETNKTASSTGVISTGNNSYLGIDDYVNCLPNTTYAITFEHNHPNASLNIAYKDNEGNFITRTSYGTNRTFTTPNNAYSMFLYLYRSDAFSTIGGYTQLEKGNRATTYEEYKGTDYEINLGKNLFYINDCSLSQNGGVVSVSNGNTITITGTFSAGTNFSFDSYVNFTNANTQLGNTMTLSVQNIVNQGTTSITPNRFFLGSVDTLLYMQPSQTTGIITKTLGETLTRCRLYVPEGTYNTTFNVQLEKGSSASSFTPYKTPIELCKIGNYQDYIFRNTTENPLYNSNLEEGQWYIHKEIGRDTITGRGAWSLINGAFQAQGVRPSDIQDISSSTMAYCNYFKYHYYASGITSNMQNGEFGWNSSKKFTIKNTSITSYNDYVTWLNNHPLELYYPLATPTNTLIEDEELINQLNEIEIFTVISEDFYN